MICSFFSVPVFLTGNWKRLFLSKCTCSTHGTTILPSYGNKSAATKPDSQSGAKDLNVET